MHVFKLVFLCFILISSANTVAEKQPTIRLALYHSPPYYFTEPPATPSGLAVDILRPVLQQLGYELQIVVCPFPRCLKMLERGEVDLMPGLLRNQEREQFVHFITPPMMNFHSSFAFYARADNPAQLTNEKQLQGKTIAVMRDAVYYPQFEQIPRLTKTSVLSEAKALEMVQQKRVDYTIMIEGTAAGAFATAGIKPSELIRQPFSVTSHIEGYLGFSKLSPNLQYVPQLEQAMATQQKLGLYQRLWQRYGIAQ